MKIKCSGKVSVEDYIVLHNKYEKLRAAVVALREFEPTAWKYDKGRGYDAWYAERDRLRAEVDALVKGDTEEHGLMERCDRMTDYDIEVPR